MVQIQHVQNQIETTIAARIAEAEADGFCDISEEQNTSILAKQVRVRSRITV